MTDKRPYRPGVGVMLLNRSGLVFVGQRIDSTAEAWQMPQGGIDPDEAPEAAAFRELAEETGVTSARIVAESRDWLSYDLPEELRDVLWKGRYRGQRQKWFAMSFEGEDSDIDIATEVPEFRAWRWARSEDLPQLIIPFKRPLYAQVLEEFDPVLRRLRG
ncbi:MAG: RNA pyrophosphohydrolase [Alphaproteobacteria bacterium]|nr:RNA pyrophosphohydrolase [Alphaproteobacteria bacterium]MDX5368281.1 RNA pyrophosphohydrolase [Alphaproteobacteria bacterium]MDX5463087.1 RNA pyrophosphohydrolase [Alphaproteobacteria bacterium]